MENILRALVVFYIVSIVYFLYKVKTGPTEKEIVKLEKFYKHTLTDEDFKRYKRQNIVNVFMCIGFLFVIVPLYSN